MKLGSSTSTASLVALVRDCHTKGLEYLDNEALGDEFVRGIWRGMACQAAGFLKARLNGTPADAEVFVLESLEDSELMEALTELVDRVTA